MTSLIDQFHREKWSEFQSGNKTMKCLVSGTNACCCNQSQKIVSKISSHILDLIITTSIVSHLIRFCDCTSVDCVTQTLMDDGFQHEILL